MIIKKSQVIIMLRRLLSNINDNFEQALAGASIIAIGASLWIDRNYFFWPPELTSTMNDQRIDIVILLLGFCLLVSAVTGNKSKFWQHLLLILCGAAIFMLALTQLWHAFLGGQMRMAHTVIGDFVIFCLIVRAAYKS